jgi:hypothetical protein
MKGTGKQIAVWLAGPLAVATTAAFAGPSGPITWSGGSVAIGGGWGRMTQLATGHWLCVTTQYPNGTNSFLRVFRSLDACRTWTRLSDVAEAGRTLDNGELVALPDGTVLLTMRSLIGGSSYHLPVYASTNRGVTWTLRSNIDSIEGNGVPGLWEPDYWLLDDGRLVVTYSNETHPGFSQMISERVSTDHGASWGPEIWAVAEAGGGNLRPGMPQMARMANGQYILVYEVVNSGNADVHYKLSDDGVNWPADLGTKIPCQHCGPFVMSLPNGLLLVSSCENQISFSEDFGATWEKADPPAWPVGFAWTWPALYLTQTNEVGAMAVTNGVSLRFGALAPRPLWPNPFTANFDGGTDPGWSRYRGNFALTAGRYQLNNAGTYGKAMVGDGFWRDGVLEADVMVNTPGNAGLMFRAVNCDDTGPDDAFGYYVGLDTAGFVVLGRMNYAWTEVARTAMSVPTNTWHHVKVTLAGSQIRIFVDDLTTPRITRTDGIFARGQIGVRSFQCDAQFDNVTFSNAAPLRLQLNPEGDQLRVLWPETAVSVKLQATTNLSPSGVASNLPATLSNGGWQSTVIAIEPSQRFFWLRAQ